MTVSLEVTATPAVTATLTVTGTSGSLVHTTAATLNVVNYSPAASPPSQTVAQGATSSPYTVTPANGFTVTVSFTASGLPARPLPSTPPQSQDAVRQPPRHEFGEHKPAWMVLPKPTESASRRRTRPMRMVRSTAQCTAQITTGFPKKTGGGSRVARSENDAKMKGKPA